MDALDVDKHMKASVGDLFLQLAMAKARIEQLEAQLKKTQEENGMRGDAL